MEKAKILKGKVRVIRDENGNRIDDIDTDMIFHNKYLHITDIKEMGKYASIISKDGKISHQKLKKEISSLSAETSVRALQDSRLSIALFLSVCKR